MPINAAASIVGASVMLFASTETRADVVELPWVTVISSAPPEP